MSFRYRRPDQPGKVYLFKTAVSGESGPRVSGEKVPAQFFLREKGRDIMSAGMDLEPLQRCHPNFFESEEFFEVRYCEFFAQTYCQHFVRESASDHRSRYVEHVKSSSMRGATYVGTEHL